MSAPLMDDDETTIHVHGLTKVFDGFEALSSVDLRIPQGVFGLLGPNGAGKTTLLNLLVGKMSPTAGTAELLGVDITDDPFSVKASVGYLPEDIGFYDDMTGDRFLRYLARLQGVSRERSGSEAERVLDLVDLQDDAADRIHTYSAGMKQRLAIAQALLDEPPILLLDEPTGELDPIARRDLLELIHAYANDGRTVVISTHVLPEIAQIADRVAIIQRGAIVREAHMAEIDDLASFYEESIEGGDT